MLEVSTKTITPKTSGPMITTQWALGRDDIYNAFSISQRPDLSGSYTVSRLSSSTSIDDLDFPPFAKDTFDPLLELTGGIGFILSVEGSDLYFELIQDMYAEFTSSESEPTVSPRELGFPAIFENQIVHTTRPFSGFTPGQSIEFGDFGGIEGDGVRIQIGDAPLLTGPRNLPDLMLGSKPNRMRGDNVYDKRRASRKQTVKESGFIGHAHRAIVHLRIQNDGHSKDRLSFGADIDLAGGTNQSIFAYPDGHRKAITAQAKRGRYVTSLDPGKSEKILYRLKTARLWAGARSDRKNDVDFTCRSGSVKDNGRLQITFR